MEGVEGNRENAAMNEVSRDLMHKLMERNDLASECEQKEVEGDEEIELSLGLSMNGRFGVDPTRKKLRRSSSVSNVVVNDGFVGNGGNPQARGVASGSHAPVVRTCSLPSGWQGQEEFHSVGGVEERRERMEKLKNVKVEKEKENCSENDGDGDGLLGDANGSLNVQRLENWNSTLSPQGSFERGGPSGISNLHGQLVKEAIQDPMLKGSSSHQGPVAGGPAVIASDDESLKKALFDMPYVSTRGFGPNHEKIEGFLYRYRMGEEVKIVCVCHGMFLSPAEFVKHGGGGDGDVSCPLKHIVVNPFPLY